MYGFRPPNQYLTQTLAAVETPPEVPTTSTDAGAGSWEDLADDWENEDFDIDVVFDDEPKKETEKVPGKPPSPAKASSPSNRKKKKKQPKKDNRRQKKTQKVGSSDEDSEGKWKRTVGVLSIRSNNALIRWVF